LNVNTEVENEVKVNAGKKPKKPKKPHHDKPEYEKPEWDKPEKPHFDFNWLDHVIDWIDENKPDDSPADQPDDLPIPDDYMDPTTLKPFDDADF